MAWHSGNIRNFFHFVCFPFFVFSIFGIVFLNVFFVNLFLTFFLKRSFFVFYVFLIFLKFSGFVAKTCDESHGVMSEHDRMTLESWSAFMIWTRLCQQQLLSIGTTVLRKLHFCQLPSDGK